MSLYFKHKFLFLSSNLNSSEIVLDFDKMGKNKSGDFFLFYNLFGSLKIVAPDQYLGLIGKNIDRKILEKNQITLEDLIISFNNQLIFQSDSAVIGSERRYFYRFMKFLVETNPLLEFIELHFIYRESPWFIVGYREGARIIVSIFQGNYHHIAYHDMDDNGNIKFSLEKYKKFYNMYMTYDNSYEN